MLRAQAEMLSQADASDDRSHAIIGANIQSMSDNVKVYLPSIEKMKRGIRLGREGNNLPAPDRNGRNFEIPHQ